MNPGDRLRGLGAAAGRRLSAGRQRVASGSWVHSTLGALDGPAAPAEETWEFSLGALVCRHPRVPAATAKVLRLLDGLGAVRFGPEGIAFDGEDARWDKVVQMSRYEAFGSLSTAALDAEVDRIRDLLPPVPGRRWAVRKIVEVLFTVLLASLEQAEADVDADADAESDAEADAGEQRTLEHTYVLCEFTRRGLLGREKTVRAGLFATALLALRPDVAESLAATAEAHGVPLVPAKHAKGQDERERIAQLRRRTDAVAERLRRARTDVEAADMDVDVVEDAAKDGA
jgi:hypothetical protein